MLFKGLTNHEPTIFHQDHLEKRKWCIVRSKASGSINTCTCTLFSEVVTLMQLILVLPATNTTSERSFSAMRRVKNYLRSTMGQQRFNHLMIFHIHKAITDDLDIIQIANNFITRNEHREHVHVFGKFSNEDLM